MTDLLDRARRLAADVLAPAAAEVDAREEIPTLHLERLARDGFYGIAAPPEVGGSALDLTTFTAVVETFASACLTTTFTWMQHHGVVRSLVATERTALRETYLPAAVRGDVRCGVAFAGAVPSPPRLWATRIDGGYRLDGEAPLVTGWGLVDLFRLSARDAATADADDDSAGIVSAVLDAEAVAAAVRAHPLALGAAAGSRTVRLEVDGLEVPEERVTDRVSRAQFLANLSVSGRINGALALGVVGHAVGLVQDAGETAAADRLRDAQDRARDALDAAVAEPATMSAARARASALAVRAAATAVTAVGSRGIVRPHPAQRLQREAGFVLVAASRPDIRAGLLDELGG